MNSRPLEGSVRTAVAMAVGLGLSVVAGAQAPAPAQVTGGGDLLFQELHVAPTSSSDYLYRSAAGADRVYVVSWTASSDTPDRLRAHDIDTGVVEWETQVSPPGPFAFVNPLLLANDESLLFSTNVSSAGTFELVARDTSTGSVVWTDDQSAASTASALASSPSGDRLFASTPTSDPSLVVTALDPASGALLWEHEIPGVHARGIAVDGSRVFALGGIAGLTVTTALDAVTGAELWTESTLDLESATGLRSATAGELVVTSGAHSPVTRVLDGATGALLWSSADYLVGVSPDGSLVWLYGSGQLVAHDGATGAAVWENNLPSGAGQFALDDSGTRIAVREGFNGGNFTAFDAQTGGLLWTTTSTANPLTVALHFGGGGSKVVATGTVNNQLTSSDAWVAAYDAVDGHELWSRADDGLLTRRGTFEHAALSPDGETLFAGGSVANGTRAELVAYDVDTADASWSQRLLGGSVTALEADSQRAVVQIGTEPFSIATFAEADGTLLWKNDLDGESAPLEPLVESRLALGPSRVYLTYVPADPATYPGPGVLPGPDVAVTVALEASNGQVLWDAIGETDWAPHALALSPDGATVVVTGEVGSDAFTVAYDAVTGAESWRTFASSPLKKEKGASIAFAPDSSAVYVVVARGAGHRVHAHDLGDGTQLWFAGAGGDADSITVHPDGSRVYAGGPGLSARAWDAATGALLWSSDAESGEGSEVVVDADGTTVYVGGSLVSSDTEARLIALDPASGDFLWGVTVPGATAVPNVVNAVVADSVRGRVYAVGSLSETPAVHDGLALAFERPRLVQASEILALAPGESLELRLRAGPDDAFGSYWMFGSVSGTSPGLEVGGVHLPLNLDPWLLFTAKKPNGPVLVDFLGLLDAEGYATARFTLPASVDPTLAGLVVHHAYLGAEVLGTPTFASNAVGVTLVP